MAEIGGAAYPTPASASKPHLNDTLDHLESVVQRAHSIEGMMEAIYENLHGPRPLSQISPGPQVPAPTDKPFVYLYERLRNADTELNNSLERIARQAEELLDFTQSGKN